MLHKGGPRLLVTDREGALYLERARVHVVLDRIVYHITDDEHRSEYNIPHVNLAVLFLGQGTSITQDAIRLLGEEGVHLAVTGTGGTPLHMGGLTNYTSTRHFRQFLPIYLEPHRSLPAAVSVMKDRIVRMKTVGAKLTVDALRQRDASPLLRICNQLEQQLAGCVDMQQLLGFEGQFAKGCYKAFSQMAGVSKDGKFRRVHGGEDMPSDIEASVRIINRMIDHGNYLAYGMAGAALWALGIPPHMSVFHGKTRAGGLVFDIADSFKEAFVLPYAFAAPKSKENHEQVFRAKLISAFNDKRVLVEAISTIENMIRNGGTGEIA